MVINALMICKVSLGKMTLFHICGVSVRFLARKNKPGFIPLNKNQKPSLNTKCVLSLGLCNNSSVFGE